MLEMSVDVSSMAKAGGKSGCQACREGRCRWLRTEAMGYYPAFARHSRSRGFWRQIDRTDLVNMAMESRCACHAREDFDVWSIPSVFLH
jgi:hypothetical protein